MAIPIDETNSLVQEELLKQAYSNLQLALFALLMNILIVATVFWDLSDKKILLSWTGLVLFILLKRYYDFVIFSKKKLNINLHLAEKKFKISALITAISIGIISFLFFPDAESIHQTFITMILAGLSAGAVMSLSMYKNLASMYLTILLTPLIYVTYMQNSDSNIHLYMSLLILLFLIMLTQFSKIYNKNILNVILSKLRVAKTEQELQNSENNFETIFHESTVGILTYNKDLIIQESNKAFTSILKAPLNKIINFDMKKISNEKVLNCLTAAINGKKEYYEGTYHTHISGEDIWISMETVPMFDAEDGRKCALAIVTDITQKVKSDEKIRYQAYYDSLTGLANRLTLNERLHSHVSKLSQTDSFSSVLFIDIDHFKSINDSLGHHVGDIYLKIFAQRIAPKIGEDNLFSRLGGDEFVILVTKMSANKEDAINIAKSLAQRLHESMMQAIIIEENALYMTLSIGIHIITKNDNNINNILKYADIAMYKAKDSGRNCSHFYKDEMSSQIQNKLNLSNDLRVALELQQFELYFQAIVEIESEKITSCEALVRWNHPQKGLIYPDNFIQHAENNDSIILIGDWVIDQACKEYQKFSEYIQDLAINISYKQFIQENFVEKLTQALKKHSIEAHKIKLELTESVAIHNLPATIKKIQLLKSLGFQIVMDDFGTGYSSLSYLKNLPFDYIKIDRTFIKEMLIHEDDASLVKTILSISKQFNFSVIAEGVETQEQIDFLKKYKCNYYQGYFKSEPLPADKFKNLLLNNFRN